MCSICKAAVTAIEDKYIGIYTQDNKDYFTLGPKMACREHSGNPEQEAKCLATIHGLRSNPTLLKGIAVGCNDNSGKAFGPYECPPPVLCNCAGE